MKLRVHLLALALGVLVPMLLLAGLATYYVVQHERETMRREGIGRVRATMIAVDAELKGQIETAQALATSGHLERGDLRSFHEESQRVLKSQPQWLTVAISSAEGRRLADARLPFGSPAGADGDGMQPYLSLLREGRPAVGEVGRDRVSGRFSIPVHVPVRVGESVRYLLTIPIAVELFQGLLTEQGLPSEWVIALADRDKRVIARIPAAPAGTPVSASFRMALEQAREGWFQGRTLEGHETYTPFVTSAFTGWALGIAIPQQLVEAAAWRASTIMAAAALLALAAAIFLAWYFGRRIATPITALAHAAKAGRGVGHAMSARPRIAELEQLSAALVEREELVERERRALEAAAEQERRLNAQRERSAAQLARINRELQERNEENELFVYSVSHDLRAPLVNLQGFSRELRAACVELSSIVERSALPAAEQGRVRALLEEEMAEAIHFITTAVSRLSGIIDALLGLSRAGRVEYHPQKVDVDRVVERVIDSLHASLGERGVETRVEPLPPCWGDPVAVEQVFANLIDNAIKYADPSRRACLQIGSRPYAERPGQRFNVYYVKDNGMGIAEAEQAKVFLPFQRVHSGRAIPGEGIGLAIVRRIVERHGGRAWLESAAGEGSTFLVSFPSGPAEAAAYPLAGDERRQEAA